MNIILAILLAWRARCRIIITTILARTRNNVVTDEHNQLTAVFRALCASKYTEDRNIIPWHELKVFGYASNVMHDEDVLPWGVLSPAAFPQVTLTL